MAFAFVADFAPDLLVEFFFLLERTQSSIFRHLYSETVLSVGSVDEVLLPVGKVYMTGSTLWRLTLFLTAII